MCMHIEVNRVCIVTVLLCVFIIDAPFYADTQTRTATSHRASAKTCKGKNVI